MRHTAERRHAAHRGGAAWRLRAEGGDGHDDGGTGPRLALPVQYLEQGSEPG